MTPNSANDVLSAVSRILIAPQLEGVCGTVGGEGFQQRLDCSFNNPLSSVTCSFDEGEPEECSTSLVLSIDRFGPGQHSVVISATDIYGQTFGLRPLVFELTGKSPNFYKTAYRTVYITNAESPPNAPRNLAVTGVTSSSFTITWSPPDGE